MDIKLKNASDASLMVEQIAQQCIDLQKLLDLQKQSVTPAAVVARLFKVSRDFKLTSLDLRAKIEVSGGSRKLRVGYGLMSDVQKCIADLGNIRTSLALIDDSSDVLQRIDALMQRLLQLKNDVLLFLNNISVQSVPPTFASYVQAVAQSIVQHMDIEEGQYKVRYLLSTYNTSLLFSAYIMLHDVQNADGDVLDRLSVSVQWLVGKDDATSEVRINLGVDYQDPSELFSESRLSVSSVRDAVKTIDSLLEAEGFEITQRIAQSPLQYDLGSMDLGAVILSLSVIPDCITVELSKNADLSSTIKELILGVQRMMGSEVRFEAVDSNIFRFYGKSTGRQFNDSDVLYFKNWGLTEKQISSINEILK